MRMMPLSVPMLYPLTCDKNPTVTILPCISNLAVAFPVVVIGIKGQKKGKEKGERRKMKGEKRKKKRREKQGRRKK